MDLADYYDHDERELNRMIHSSGPERIYMADPQDGGGDTLQQRDGEDGGARRDSETGGGWRRGDEDKDDGHDGDDGDWPNDRDERRDGDCGDWQGGDEDRNDGDGRAEDPVF